jgi:hypothetical protein
MMAARIFLLLYKSVSSVTLDALRFSYHTIMLLVLGTVKEDLSISPITLYFVLKRE